MLEQLRARLQAMVGRGRVKLSDLSGPFQKVQIDQGRHQGLIDGVPLMQHFGFASRPPSETDVVVIYTNGDLANGTAVASNSQTHRPPALLEGDAAIHDVRGVYLWLTKDGPVLDAGGLAVKVQNAKSFEVTASDHVTLTAPRVTVAASSALKLDSPAVEVTGALKVDPDATGVFTSADGHTITVAAGVITRIV